MLIFKIKQATFLKTLPKQASELTDGQKYAIAKEPPKSTSPRRWLDLDRLGVLQVLGGIALGLIALFSSYDHITLAGRTLQLQQQ
jgi:hypothetical protein